MNHSLFCNIYIWSKNNLWNVNCTLATTFIFDSRTDLLVKVSKFIRQKMSRPEGTWTITFEFKRNTGLVLGPTNLYFNLYNLSALKDSRLFSFTPRKSSTIAVLRSLYHCRWWKLTEIVGFRTGCAYPSRRMAFDRRFIVRPPYEVTYGNIYWSVYHPYVRFSFCHPACLSYAIA